MIDHVIHRLKDMKYDVDREFHGWYEQAVKIADSVGVEPSTPRISKCWSRYRDNVPSETPEKYYKKNLAVPFLDDITDQLEDRLHDRNHAEIFGLLPSVMSMPSFDVESTTSAVVEKFQDELIDDGIHSKSELKRWCNMWKQEILKRQQCYKDDMEKERKKKKNIYLWNVATRSTIQGKILRRWSKE